MTLPNQLTTMGEGVFSYCTALESMVLPNSLYTLAWGTFYDCTNLQEVQLPNEISQIPDGTFWNCRKLRKVSLSKEIALIGDSIFDSCESLHTVNYGGTMEEWRDIPKGSFNEYLNKAVMIRCTDGTIYRDLAAPLQVKVALYGYDDIKASWSKVNGADGYFVYYKKSTASTYTLLCKTTALSYKKANLSDGAKYYFRVYPYIKDGDTYIKDSSYKTSSGIYTLKKVSGVKAARNGSKVKVSWTNINGESGYQISRSTKKTGTSIVKTYSTTSGKYYNVSATKGKTYYYKVRAYKTVNGTKTYGPWSSVVKYKRTR